jgi:molecular chaperone GrpE
VDEAIKEELLSRFIAYLDGLDGDVDRPGLNGPGLNGPGLNGPGLDGPGLDAPDLNGSCEVPAGMAEGVSEEADLFSVFVEVAGVRNEVRTQSRIVKEALDRFRSVFDTLQSSHATLAHDRERALLKPLLLDIIDVRDRLAAGLKPSPEDPTRRWYARFLPQTKPTVATEAWREGLRMTLRRVDRLLTDQHIAIMETVGRPLDPRHAAAVATVDDPSAADGVVVEEVRSGFLWHGDLLRPAEVIVARRDARNGGST